MEISFHSHLDSNTVIATKLCTWHDSCAVVACEKIVAIWWPATELWQGEISIVFELPAKIVSETGPGHKNWSLGELMMFKDMETVTALQTLSKENPSVTMESHHKGDINPCFVIF